MQCVPLSWCMVETTKDLQNQRFSFKMQMTTAEVQSCNTNMLPIGQVQINITCISTELCKLTEVQWSAGDWETLFCKGRIKSPGKY